MRWTGAATAGYTAKPLLLGGRRIAVLDGTGTAAAAGARVGTSKDRSCVAGATVRSVDDLDELATFEHEEKVSLALE